MRFPAVLSTSTAALAVAVALSACAPAAKDFTPKTDEEKQLYTLGVLISRNIQSFELSDSEIAVVKAGVDQGSRDHAKLTTEEMEKLIPALQELQKKRTEASSAKAKEAGTAYLAKAAAEAGVAKLDGGIILKITKDGTGALPQAGDTVKVNYEGKLISGKVFDSSIKRGEPATFPLAAVIPCWGKGMQQIKVGGKAQLTCPADQAYGPEGHPPEIPGNSVLVFDVELLEIVKADAPAAAEAAPAAPAGKPGSKPAR